MIVSECYLVEVKLAHERTGEGVAAVHCHDDRPRVSRGDQGSDGLQEAEGQPALLDLALLGPHQFLS